MLSCIGNKSQVESKIMNACNLHCQQFLSLKEMVKICLSMNPVQFAAFTVDWREIIFPLLVSHVHRTIISKQHCISTVSCWHYAVEHVYASFDCLQYVLRCSYSHKVSRFVFRQDFIHNLNHLIHYLCRLANSKSANGIAISPLVGNMFCSIS